MPPKLTDARGAEPDPALAPEATPLGPGHLTSVRLVERVAVNATAAVWQGEAVGTGELVALKVGLDVGLGPWLGLEAYRLLLVGSPHLPELKALGWIELSHSAADGEEPDELARDTTLHIDARLPAALGGSPEPRASRAQGRRRLPVLCTSWIEGQRLTELVGRDEPDAMEVLRIAADLGAALADLHAAGIAHGDVKPANAIRAAVGRACLLDLGLAGPSDSIDVRGGTPRYLATGDRALGDARARDLLALGVMLAELGSARVAAADTPLAEARTTILPAPLGHLCAALLAPEPSARPSAAWVRDWALGLLGADAARDASAATREVRARYLRLRRNELWHAEGVRGDVAPWLGQAVEAVARARAMGATAPGSELGASSPTMLGPLDAAGRAAWIAALTSSPASSWSSSLLAQPPERDLAERLCLLTARKRPAAWTLRELERAVGAPMVDLDPAGGRATAAVLDANAPSAAASPTMARTDALDAERAADLALKISRVPIDGEALELVERLAERAPLPLRLAAADGLRLRGELGRARALVQGLVAATPIAVDILRRAGDWDEARAMARRCVDEGSDPDGRARACWARICLDAGQPREAAALVDEPSSAALAEIAALLQHARGHARAARALAERSLALASSSEERARAWATAAYVTAASSPAEALDGYRAAESHARQAGAVLEEATYLTSDAALSVDLGQIEAAIRAATRAASLWEHVLVRPAQAARAHLAGAAAYAAVGAVHETLQWAARAVGAAASAGDRRAAAYAWWALADACAPDDPQGAEAARRADSLLEAFASMGSTPPTAHSNDAVHAAARLWRHLPSAVDESRRSAIDSLASAAGTVDAHARLAWWGARAERLSGTDPARARPLALEVLQQLAALTDVVAPVAARAYAMHAGAELAAGVSEPGLARQLDSARERAAATLRAGCPTWLSEAALGCRYLAPPAPPGLDLGQAFDLQQLVRALGERGSLRALLTHVLDVMLQWTGAERGLVLLRDEKGELVPRAARNLQRQDLEGEQLVVSRTLAERAIESGGPVVAVDAMDELGERFASVHALRLRSVLVTPLAARGEVLGVVYLDDRVRRGAFGSRELGWADSVAPVAALAIADASAQASLRRQVRRAERATAELERVLAHKQTALELAERELAHVVERRATRFAYDEIVGQSEPMQSMLRLVDRVSVADVPVLLRGGSGSGKELVARAIHRHSERATAPFVGENCAALPEPLLESALFGHVRGAFTSAVRSRIGLFEAAHGGTLFLDEIGEMSVAMQTRLLRVLEDGEVRPVGSERSRHVDVRVIAATHRDLERMVAEGAFREDLYYRLNVVSVTIPPLRDRAEDIPLLVRHFLALHTSRQHAADGGAARVVTPEALAVLCAFPWPGNVRQLENEIRRAVLLCDGPIDVEHLSPTIAAAATSPPATGRHRGSSEVKGLHVRDRVDQLEVDLVRQALDRTGGNQTKAAQLLGISRYGLHKMMRRLGLSAARSDAPRD